MPSATVPRSQGTTCSRYTEVALGCSSIHPVSHSQSQCVHTSNFLCNNQPFPWSHNHSAAMPATTLRQEQTPWSHCRPRRQFNLMPIHPTLPLVVSESEECRIPPFAAFSCSLRLNPCNFPATMQPTSAVQGAQAIFASVKTPLSAQPNSNPFAGVLLSAENSWHPHLASLLLSGYEGNYLTPVFTLHKKNSSYERLCL